jgi:hypothetical protein
MSEYYSHGSVPQNGTPGDADEISAEFEAIETATNKLPTLAGNASKVVKVNSAGTALEAVASAVELAGTTTAATAKTTPVDADYLPIVDSEALNVLKKLTFANLWVWVQSKLNGATAKTTPTGADTIPISDSAAAGVTKTLSFTNLVAYLIGVVAGKAAQVDQAVTATTRAATTTLGTTLQHTLSDTSTTITAFNGVAGVTYHCKALGAGGITHSAGLSILQGGASIVTAAGDTFDVYMLTATTCEVRNYLGSEITLTTGALNTARGTVVMHATTMDLWAQPNIIDGTGSAVPITAIMNAPQPGATRTVYPPAGTIITQNAMFAVDGGASVTTDAGDGLTFEAVTVSTYKVHIAKTMDGVTTVVAATRDLADASGVVSYALGYPSITPKWVTIRGVIPGSLVGSQGFYGVGSGSADEYTYGATGLRGIGTGKVVMAAPVDLSNYQDATATLLPNTIELTWAKTGTPTGVLVMTMEVHF